MLAVYKGANSDVMVRQSREEGFLPELYIKPVSGRETLVREAVMKRLRSLHARYPGLSVATHGELMKIVIPAPLRTNDIEYFGMLAQRVAGFVRDPSTFPAWENPNLLAKYWVTTQGVATARRAR